MKKISILSVCIIALAAFAAWAPNVSAMQSFESPGAGGLSCAQCHPVFGAGPSDPDHVAHAEPAGNDCNSCHLGSFNDPPIGNNCTRCHGRLEDVGGDDISAGEGRGLRQHHQNAGASNCGLCHSDATGPAGVGEDVPPAFYPGLGDVSLDSCDGTEEGFPSNTVSLDNDGNLLTDGADPACAEPECTVDADCDDGTFCNGAETCDANGTCVAGTPPSCDDDVACTDDACDATLDECVNTPNDASCDDNNVCNGIETCDLIAGCMPGIDLDCDDGELCTTDTCNPVTGCVFTPVDCGPDQQCDPETGQCVTPPECTVDADCDNGFFCDGTETCDTATGTCQAGTDVDCDDGVVCTVDTCDEVNDECMNMTDDTSCDDNNVCNGSETCDPVNDCQPGTALDCDDGNLCTTDSCDPLTGCANVPVECPVGDQCDPADGICKAPPGCTVDADCDDNMFCNGAETCDTATGTCQPGTPPDCDDVVGCTVDTCDEANDACVNTPDDAFCDDGDVCTGSETCDPVNDCQPGEPLVCDDGNLCTTDGCDDPVTGCVFTPVNCGPDQQCDPGTGECVIPPDCTGDADCDDNMFCNGAETCDTATGTCQPGTPVDCDDGVDCTVDTCDEVDDECANTPDDNACPDDELFCTGDEICDPAAGCVSTGDPCPEGMTCNEDTDTCDMVSDKVTICHIPPGNPAKAKTKSIDAESASDHLAHGDTLGPCTDDDVSEYSEDGEDDEDGEDGEDDDDNRFNPPADHTDKEDGFLHAPGKDKPLSNGCTSCHGSELTGSDSGGFAPSCFTCHGMEWDEDDDSDDDDDDDDRDKDDDDSDDSDKDDD